MAITIYEEYRDGRHFVHEESGVYLRGLESRPGEDAPVDEIEVKVVDDDGPEYMATEERRDVVEQLLDAALAYYDENFPGVEIRAVVADYFENWELPLYLERGFTAIEGWTRHSTLLIRGWDED